VSDSFICELHGNPVRPAEAFTDDQCRFCWLQATGALSKVPPMDSPVWPELPASLRPRRPECIHLDGIIEWCPFNDCYRHLHHCLHENEHGLDGNRVRRGEHCAHCPDFELGVPQAKHLLYHVYPRAGNGIWQLNADMLKARLPLFNGDRHICALIDEKCDSLDTVAKHFAGERIDSFTQIPNDPNLREVASWLRLWEKIDGKPGAVFWGHAKGVTHPVNAGVSVHRWTRILYEANLDYWPIVAEFLRRRPLAGALLKVGHGFRGSRSAWHFSGGMFWVRAELVGRLWETVDRTWWGTESWPGVHWQPGEAGNIFHSGVVPTLDMYSVPYVSHVEEEFARWKLQHSPIPTRTG
jgi:hypothetical protein